MVAADVRRDLFSEGMNPKAPGTDKDLCYPQKLFNKDNCFGFPLRKQDKCKKNTGFYMTKIVSVLWT